MVRLVLAGALSFWIVWLSHEIITFGIGHGFLTGERQLGGGVVPSSVSEMLLLRGMLASIAAMPLAGLGVLVKAHQARPFVLAVAWTGLALLGLVITADGYRIEFGTTWLWHEPFAALMFSLWLTPLCLGLGLAGFLMTTRKQAA